MTQGTNVLAKLADAPALIEKAAAGEWKKGRIPELWDGNTAGRVAESLRGRT